MKKITCPICGEKTPNTPDRVVHHLLNHIDEKDPLTKLLKKVVTAIIKKNGKGDHDFVLSNAIVAVAGIILEIEEERSKKEKI